MILMISFPHCFIKFQVFYYSTDLFQRAGLPDDIAKFMTIGIGLIMVVMTIITIPLMDRMGRRTLHLYGLGGMFIFSIFITISFLAKVSTGGIHSFSTFGGVKNTHRTNIQHTERIHFVLNFFFVPLLIDIIVYHLCAHSKDYLHICIFSLRSIQTFQRVLETQQQVILMERRNISPGLIFYIL